MIVSNNIWTWIAAALAGGLVLSLVAFWISVNRRKSKQIREELQTILDTLEPVALIDTSYNIIRVNELYAAAAGRNYQSLIGRKCYKVHEDRNSPCPGCQLYKALLERKPQMMPAVQWKRDGLTVYYDISFHPLMNGGDNVDFVVEVRKDITTLHNIKTSLEEQKQDLERKTRELAEKNKALTQAYAQLETALDEKNQDLEMARDIQRSLLPENPQGTGSARFWSTYEPIQQVGGDLYDFIPLGEHRFGVFIGDVSGHGLAAAFITSLTKLSLHNNLTRSDSPSQLLKAINNDLRHHLKTGHYLTAFYGIIDLKNNHILYARGSHPPPVLLHANGDMSRLEAKGMLIGILPEPEYVEQENVIMAGDRLFLFTDGCFGLTNAQGEVPITYTRFLELLQTHGALPLGAVYPALHEHMRQEVGSGMLEDDRTFIAIEITKPPLRQRYCYLLHFDHFDRVHRVRIARRKDMDLLLDQIVNVLEREAYSERLVSCICNSVQEVVINALTHGHQENPDLKAMVAWSVTQRGFRFSITDKGKGYDPQSLNIGPRRGNGLLLVRTYMDEVFVDNGGRTISLHRSKNV